MSVHPKQEWLDRSNAQTLHHLERQGRTGPGLVPFLGAGLSTPYKLKNWRDLLLGAAPPRLAPGIKKKLDANDYEGAAEAILQELGADGFQNMVAASAGDSNIEPFDFRTGTVSLLPLLASGPVVTTNFDRVLERAFEANGAPFESVISGPRPDLIVDALHGNRRVLIKLHGDWQDRVGRTFAKSDYDANYGEGQPERKRELLEGVERLLFSSRSLLFIGASLGPDRTVKLLQEVHKEYAGIRHFAIVKAPTDPKEFDEREKHFRTCGVLPFWYHAEKAEDHASQVEKLVAEVVERISVRTIAEPLAQQPLSAPVPPAPVKISLPGLPELDAHFDRVLRFIWDGRLTFFLGSAIHSPTKLMAKEFYEELARVFECEALGEEPFAVAQYIADRHGRENLYAEIRTLFEIDSLIPRDTHELFAAWQDFKTLKGRQVPFPTVITTNYDNVLEDRLAAAGLPYHLLSYQADGPYRGLFYHRTPDDGLRVIERPGNIREFSDDAFVVMKLNGSLETRDQQNRVRIPESYVTTRLDFWDLASRIPEVLPAAIQRTLSANPLLFLGHGLAAQDVESLVRFAHRDHPGPRSWAVVLKRQGIEYWRQCGVEIIDRDVNLYVNELRRRLTKP
ncbi:MAG TPA: SIR2 family protein [Thermoanaerobaculia bacterium]|jgi:hypothetical protein|nr:SIR2 family protein [Thermoanaerobaculia bacterium]